MKVRGDSRAIDRARTATLRRRQERDRALADDHVCSCGWITALPVCPMCDGVRVVAER